MSAARLVRLMSQSLATQVASSLTSFLLSMFLVRNVTLEQFGWYNIAFAVAVFVGGIGNVAAVTQMVITLPTLPVAARDSYAQRMSLFALSIAAGVVLLGVLVSAVSVVLESSSSLFDELCIATAVFAAAQILRDLVWRYAFAIDRGVIAFFGASMSLALTGCGVLFLAGQDREVSAFEVLVGYSVVMMGTAAISMKALHLAPASSSWLLLSRDAAAAWHNGRWALLSHGINVLRSQSYNFVVIIIAGASAVGAINAVRLMFVPAIIALPAVSNVLLPGLARMASADVAVMHRRAHIYAVALMSVAFAYGGAVLIAYGEVRARLLGDGNWSDEYLRHLWAIYVVLLAGRACYELAAQASRSFRQISVANGIATGATIALAAGLATEYGADGAMVGLLLGELVLILLLRQQRCRITKWRV